MLVFRKTLSKFLFPNHGEDPNQQYIVERFCDQFKKLWTNEDENCTVISMPQAIKENLLKVYRSETPPTEAEAPRIL